MRTDPRNTYCGRRTVCWGPSGSTSNRMTDRKSHKLIEYSGAFCGTNSTHGGEICVRCRVRKEPAVTSSVPDNSHDDAHGVSRREFARLGLFAGGIALTAPSIRTISFAGKAVGSVHTPPPSTTPTSSTPVTQGGASETSTSSTATSSTTTTVLPGADEKGAAGGSGTLPFTGAAIGGLAVVGGAAVAVGRAMTGASNAERVDEHQSLPEDDEDV